MSVTQTNVRIFDGSYKGDDTHKLQHAQLEPRLKDTHVITVGPEDSPEDMAALGASAGVQLMRRARERLAYQLGLIFGMTIATVWCIGLYSDAPWYVTLALLVVVLGLDLVFTARHSIPMLTPEGARWARKPWWAFWRAPTLEIRVMVVDAPSARAKDIASTLKR